MKLRVLNLDDFVRMSDKLVAVAVKVSPGLRAIVVTSRLAADKSVVLEYVEGPSIVCGDEEEKKWEIRRIQLIRMLREKGKEVVAGVFIDERAPETD